MKDYLTFNLYAPLQSWGEIAVGEKRHTALHPTKSGIMGLLAASLGIKRSSENDKRHQQLFDNLSFGVRINSPGSLLSDYHTTQRPKLNRFKYATRRDELLEKDLSTGLSTRDYRCDAFYTIAVWSETGYDLKKLQLALKNPVFTLYLGRKSCPLAFPLEPLIYRASNLVEALKQVSYPKELKILLPKNQKHVEIYWEGEDTELKPIHKNSRRDNVFSRSRWQFSDRTEFYTTVSIDEN